MEDPIALVLFYLLAGTIVFLIIFITKKQKRKHAKEKEPEIIQQAEEYPYTKKYLLTKNEWDFYKLLKPIAQDLGYYIIAKTRLADLIQVNNYVDNNDYYKYFAKIKAKHIDFALCDPNNLEPIIIIELDDQSHQIETRKERDEFVDNALENAGYQIIHTYSSTNLKELILKTINPEKS